MLISNSVQRPVIDLWPAGPPDGWKRIDAEKITRDEGAGFSVLSNVSHPTLEFFASSTATIHSPTVVVCPGGGYYIEAFEHEGLEIAERLNSAGFNAAVLKYRLPNRDADHPLHKAPLQDAQRAIRVLRSRAAEFHLDPNLVGIMGFSAGGHLAAAASVAKVATYLPVDNADDLSIKPYFTVLIYPAYLDTQGKPEMPSDVTMSAEAPPAFVLQSVDDPYAMSAFSYALACHQHKVPVELHMFPKGGHGYGLRSKEPGLSGWMDLLTAWLNRLSH